MRRLTWLQILAAAGLLLFLFFLLELRSVPDSSLKEPMIYGLVAMLAVAIVAPVGAVLALFRLRYDHGFLRIAHGIAIGFSLLGCVVIIVTGMAPFLMLILIAVLSGSASPLPWICTLSFLFMMAAPLILRRRAS